MPHGNRPEETPPTALESAAHDVRRILSADGAESAGSLAQRTAVEAHTLRDWAKTRGLILDPARWLAPAHKGGAEHVVWRDDTIGRVIKLTLPGECGWTVDAQLLGVLDAGSGMQVVTSQPTIRGEPPEPEQIADFMQALGFEMLPPVVVRNSGALAFLRERDEIAAFDCHAGNFFVSDGQVLPIDVILVRASEPLLNALAATH